MPAVNGYFRNQEKSADFLVDAPEAADGRRRRCHHGQDPERSTRRRCDGRDHEARAGRSDSRSTGWQPGTSPQSAEQGDAAPAKQAVPDRAGPAKLAKLSRSIEGRVAIITGAASGMGRATAYVFADEGARLALVDRNADGVEQVADEVNAAGGTAQAYARRSRRRRRDHRARRQRPRRSRPRRHPRQQRRHLRRRAHRSRRVGEGVGDHVRRQPHRAGPPHPRLPRRSRAQRRGPRRQHRIDRRARRDGRRQPLHRRQARRHRPHAIDGRRARPARRQRQLPSAPAPSAPA